MCGIAGFVGPGSQEDLQLMCAALRHRGPDAADVWLGEAPRVGLAHARLSVLDHAGGAQPMWTADRRLAIVFNGEIYNFAQLRGELTALGHTLRSGHSDTEAVLLGYRQWGEDVCSRLNGMWAFLIVDFERGRLFASRDRFGKKPFYYQAGDGGFLFASELKALLAHPACRRELDTLSLKKYFAYGYIPAPRTQFSSVRKLPAGHWLSLDLRSSALHVRRWWRFELQADLQLTQERAREELGAKLEAAVARRLVADVPVGMFLSGGIDSSLVSVLAARHLPRGRFKTFSIGFDEASFDESAMARAVARHIGADHVEERLRTDDALAIAESVCARLDEPLSDSSVLPTSMVSELARRHVTVALGGDGADELFAGYGPFLALRWATLLHRLLPAAAIRGLEWAVNRLPVSHGYMSLDFKLKRALAGIRQPQPLWVPSWMAPVAAADVNSLVRDGAPHAPEEIFSEVLDAWDACAQQDLASRAMQFFVELYLQDGVLAKVDRASMMHALEVRAPFLDIELVDFVRRLPMRYKLAGRSTKKLLRQVAAPLLPPQVVQRPKQGFAVPVGRWFQQGQLGIDATQLPSMIDASMVRTRLARHRSGQSDERLFLWSLFALQRAAGMRA